MQQLIDEIKSDYDQKQWEFNLTFRKLLKQVISSLPKSKNISIQETRYPKSPEGMRAFLDKFFARHFFQIQDSLLDVNSLTNLITAIRSKRLTIADIGCGPGIGTLAVLDFIQHLQTRYNILPDSENPLSLSIILNDSSTICLEYAQMMIEAFLPKLNYSVKIKKTNYLKDPFPESIYELRRFVCRYGMFNLGILSYVLTPLKEQMTYSKLCAAIDKFIRLFYPLNCSCLIIQDKFRKPLLKKISRLLNSSSEKCQPAQMVYDPSNSNASQTYTYFRSIVTSNRVYKKYHLPDSTLKSITTRPMLVQ